MYTETPPELSFSTKMWHSFKASVVFVLLSLPFIVNVSSSVSLQLAQVRVIGPLVNRVGVDTFSIIVRGAAYLAAVLAMMYV